MKSTKFQFTRHLLSCNNINEGKLFGKNFEPGATIYGIFETIKYAQREEQKKYFTFNHVYVSNLYRTWITAFLLYGTNLSPTDTLNIYISPFLKEELQYGIIKHGNFPKKISIMSKKFLAFLDQMYMFCMENKNLEEINKLYTANNRKVWYKSLPTTIVLTLPPGKFGNIQTIVYKKQKNNINSCYELTSFYKIEDTAGPSSGTEFTQTGNLQKFMEWYNSPQNYYGNQNEKRGTSSIVNIVSHSRIMRAHLSKFTTTLNDLPFNIDDDIIGLKDIRNSNTWHFITNENKINQKPKSISYLTNNFDLQKGVPNKSIRGIAKSLEINLKSYSLCSKKGKTSSAKEIYNKTTSKKTLKSYCNKPKKI